MKKSDIKMLVITGFGLNCEKETAAAGKLAGAIGSIPPVLLRIASAIS